MSGLNKILLIGRLGKDPEIKYSQSGTAVCQLSLATSEKYKDKAGEMVEKTEWSRCVAFGKQAETLEKYLSKGDQIFLEGKLQTRNYEKDGQTHYVTEVVVTGFQFLGGGQKQQAPQQGYQQPHQNGYQPQGNPQIPDDDLPF